MPKIAILGVALGASLLALAQDVALNAKVDVNKDIAPPSFTGSWVMIEAPPVMTMYIVESPDIIVVTTIVKEQRRHGHKQVHRLAPTVRASLTQNTLRQWEGPRSMTEAEIVLNDRSIMIAINTVARETDRGLGGALKWDDQGLMS